MIKSIRTKNLYNRYNYNFDLSKNVMTIISGPNGYGKTTLLKAIRDILDDDLIHLAQIPFEELEFRTDDNKKILFQKDGKSFFINGERVFVPLTINGTGKKDERTFFTLKAEDIEEIKKLYNKQFVSQQQLLTVSYVIFDDEEIEGINSEDILLRINAQLAETEKLNYIRDLLSFYKSVGNSIYSGADRLYREYGINDGHLGKRVLKEVIVDLPKQLEEVFKIYDNDYTGISNNLDYFFMSDLSAEIKENVDNSNGNIYTKNDFEKDKDIIEKQRSKLISYNFIIDKSKLPKSSFEFNEKYSLVFKVFNKNYISKLMVLKELTDKLDLFIKIINTKFSNKKMVISRMNGADSIIIKDGDNTIPLRDLSSGEKEIILMYFKLIFETNNSVIALVDEPELSSHVSWQYEVLDDFDKIIKVNKNVKQIIVCTHSPQIVNDRWNQTIDLFNEDEKQDVDKRIAS